VQFIFNSHLKGQGEQHQHVLLWIQPLAPVQWYTSNPLYEPRWHSLGFHRVAKLEHSTEGLVSVDSIVSSLITMPDPADASTLIVRPVEDTQPI
jgi:hypothetical protein